MDIQSTTTVRAKGAFTVDEHGDLSGADEAFKELRDVLISKFGYPSKTKKEVKPKTSKPTA